MLSRLVSSPHDFGKFCGELDEPDTMSDLRLHELLTSFAEGRETFFCAKWKANVYDGRTWVGCRPFLPVRFVLFLEMETITNIDLNLSMTERDLFRPTNSIRASAKIEKAHSRQNQLRILRRVWKYLIALRTDHSPSFELHISGVCSLYSS